MAEVCSVQILGLSERKRNMYKISVCQTSMITASMIIVFFSAHLSIHLCTESGDQCHLLYCDRGIIELAHMPLASMACE